jgi:hypothetical protein
LRVGSRPHPHAIVGLGVSAGRGKRAIGLGSRPPRGWWDDGRRPSGSDSPPA